MKKEYSKPELFAESFKVVEHIATICYNTAYENQRWFFKNYANHGDPSNCTFTDPGDGSILFGSGDCTTIIDYNYYQLECYENAVEPMMAFAGS